MKLKERIKNITFWLVISLAITLILGIITRITGSDVFLKATIISCIPWVLFIIVAIIFAWIINPIKSFIQKIKDSRG